MLFPTLLLAFAAAPTAVLTDPGFHIQPTLSADGKTLVYASAPGDSAHLQLWVRSPSDGTARQLTSAKADAHQPSVSPDGQLVAYRGEAKGGGIYLLGTKGGSPKLVAAGGRQPRFAPDGQRIAYLKGAGEINLMDVRGRRSKAMGTAFSSVADIVWSPDGKYLLIAGCANADAAICDWYVGPVDGGGAPASLGTASVFKPAHIAAPATPNLWLGGSNRVIFTANTATGARLWEMPLSSESPWKIAGKPRRLIAAETDQRWPAAAPGGTLLYTSRAENIDVFVKPIEANRGKPKGPLARVTVDPSIDQRPTLSEDGRRIAWETSRGGNFEVWVKDLARNEEHAITSGPLREHMPAMRRDGAKLVYDSHDGDKVTVLLAEFAGGAPTRVVEENVGQGSFQFSARGDQVLYFHRGAPGTVGLLDLNTKKRTPILRNPKVNLSLNDARLSPDGKWIVFPVPGPGHRSRLAVAPVTAEAQADDKLWTYLHPETYNAYQPEWSPDGRFLYFLSERGGRLAIWAMPVNERKQPGGPARAIEEFPTERVSISDMRPRDIGLAVARDKLALGVATYSASLWKTVP